MLLSQQQAPILITGGGQRIGYYCALKLAEQGHEVWISYRRESDRIEQLRQQGIRCFQVDFDGEAAIAAFIELIESQTSKLRAIIHNASGWLTDQPGQEAAIMSQMVNVHMLAPYMINLRLSDLFIKQGQSDIIHITDFVVEQASDNHIAYAASKAGLDSMSRSFAKLLAPKVQVNTIQPALLLFNQQDDDAYKRKALCKSLLEIEPGERALLQAVNFLLESEYMTGRTIKLDGGRHLKSS